MNGFDVVIIGVLGIQAILGFQRGFVRIFFDILAILAGIAFGFLHYKEIGAKLQIYLNISPLYINLASFICIWAAIVLVVYLLSKIINTVVTLTGLGLMNRLGGFVLGATKGVFMILPVIVPLFFLNIGIVEQSRIIQPFRPYLESMLDLYLQSPIQNQTTNLDIANETMTNRT